jgi:hypothetical protein
MMITKIDREEKSILLQLRLFRLMEGVQPFVAAPLSVFNAMDGERERKMVNDE